MPVANHLEELPGVGDRMGWGGEGVGGVVGGGLM